MTSPRGDSADDRYRRLGEGVRLIADLGLRAYWFSIAWPQPFPEGAGRLNKAGLAISMDPRAP